MDQLENNKQHCRHSKNRFGSGDLSDISGSDSDDDNSNSNSNSNNSSNSNSNNNSNSNSNGRENWNKDDPNTKKDRALLLQGSTNMNENENVGDLLTDVGSTPLITEKQRRQDMIHSEMEGIFEDVQEYLLRHMMDEVFIMDDVKVACCKSALQLAYRKKYNDLMEDTIVYFPTCKKLILSSKLMEEAEKYYHNDGGDDNDDDVIPVEISKALRAVVLSSRKIKEKKGRNRNNNKNKQQQKSSRRRKQLKNYTYNDNDDDDDEDSIGSQSIDDNSIEHDSLYDSAVMERLAMSWREATDETLENRLALC